MLVIADMDGTLTESRQAIDQKMVDVILKLLKNHYFCIISGATYERIKSQVLNIFPLLVHMTNLYVVAQSGAEIYAYNGLLYKKTMSSAAKRLIELLIRNSGIGIDPEFFVKHGIKIGQDNPMVVDKGGQITYSIIGVNTDIQIKKATDPDASRRKEIVAYLKPFLPPGIEMAIGGTTSIDFTPKGINKRSGVQYIQRKLDIDIKDILYIGDKCFEGGNDWIGSEYKYRNVSGPEETLKILQELM